MIYVIDYQSKNRSDEVSRNDVCWMMPVDIVTNRTDQQQGNLQMFLRLTNDLPSEIWLCKSIGIKAKLQGPA